MTRQQPHRRDAAPRRGKGIGLAWTVLSLLSAPMAMAQQTTMPPVRLASANWPPFSGPTLDGQGLSTTIVTRALALAGFRAEVEFLPWQRAVGTGLGDEGFAGYFPEYRSAGLEAGRCLLSHPIGSSPLGFAERADNIIPWHDLTDLTGRRIGTVRGYVNTDAFDTAAAAGHLSVEPAVDDVTNLRKLAAGRLDMVVIDANVLTYLLKTVPELAPVAAQVHFNARALENKSLHVCFRPGPAGEQLRGLFNQALQQLHPESRPEVANRRAAD